MVLKGLEPLRKPMRKPGLVDWPPSRRFKVYSAASGSKLTSLEAWLLLCNARSQGAKPQVSGLRGAQKLRI